jgi:hypothetical protein
VPDFHSTSWFAPTDDRESAGLRRSGKQLIVLAEAQILVRRAGRERDPLELDHEPATGARGDVLRAAGKAVREIEHRVRLARQLDPLVDA